MAFCIWMTGLPCSGKTTIVRKLTENIPNLAILDGDELREWLSPKNFSKEARDEHQFKVAHLAKLLLKHNVPMGVSTISPYESKEQYPHPFFMYLIPWHTKLFSFKASVPKLFLSFGFV